MLAIFYDMELDVSGLLTGYDVVVGFERNGQSIRIIRLNGQEFILAQIGFTKVENAEIITFLNDTYGIDRFILTGNTAAFSAGLLTVGVASTSFQYDVDFTAIGYQPYQIPRLAQSYFNTNESLVALANTTAANLGYNVNLGIFASADRFMASTADITALNTASGASYIDSESGTVGEVAFLENKPYVVVKGVSNNGGDTAVSQYAANKTNASLIAFRIGLAMADAITRAFVPCCRTYTEISRCECLNLLARGNYCVMSTCCNNRPYGVPMDYIMVNRSCGRVCIIMFSNETGRKIRYIRNNPLVSINVVVNENNGYKSVIVSGRAYVYNISTTPNRLLNCLSGDNGEQILQAIASRCCCYQRLILVESENITGRLYSCPN